MLLPPNRPDKPPPQPGEEPPNMRRALRLLHVLCTVLILSVPLYAGDHEGWTAMNFNNENGLPQNSIIFAQMDNDGYLWLATQAGLVRYDGQRFRLFDNSNSSLLRNRYLMLGKDSSGRIYAIDDYIKTAFYTPQSGFSKPAFMPGIVPAADGGLIDLNRLDIGKLAPLIKINSLNNYVNAVSFVYYPTGKASGFIIWSFVVAGYVSNGKVRRLDSVDCNNYIYRGSMGSVGGKLCYIDKKRDFVLIDSNGVRTSRKIPVAMPWDKLLKNIPAVSFFQQEDQLLVNVDGDIYEIKLNHGEPEFHHLIRVKAIQFITCIRYYPKQNLLIIGSNTLGLFIFKKQQLVSVGRNQANADAFYAVVPYGNNQVLTTSGILSHSRSVPGIFDALNRYSLLRDRNRHYWYTNWLTLVETDDQFRVLKRLPLAKSLVCMRQDEQGTIWLAQYPRDFGRLQADTFQPYKLEGTDGKNIASFIPAGNQTFWLVGKGLCMWLDVKHHRQHIYHEFDNIELRTAYLDKRGGLWLGSYGQGHFLFQNGRFIKMPEGEEHYLKIVNCFLEDRNGFMWMTTNNGLFQTAVDDLYRYASGKTKSVYHHYYGKESGLISSEFNGGCNPSGAELDNGRFAFPSMAGVVLFHPDSIQPVLPAGKLFIEQILLDGKPAGRPELLKIAPSFKRLELIVSSPYLGNPNNLHIQYNIGGLDDRWYSLGENNRLVLNQLKYGQYKIRFRKVSGFGGNNYVTAELPLVVMPFFYQTWWFRILVIAGVVLLILLIIRIRYRYLIRQRNRLETEVKDRTNELAYHTRLMEKLTVMIAHDLKSPLHFLSKVTGHLRNNVQQQNLQAIDRTSGEIKNTADQVYQFIEGFNLWASSFTDGFNLNKTSFVLGELLQELGLFFKDMTEAHNNKLLMVNGASYLLHTDRELLKIIIRNIIDNANKHGRGCDIMVSAAEAPLELVCITIADTGQGMQEPVLKRIQDRIRQATSAASIERNSRLGYQMIIDFAARLGAKLEVQSEAGKGTRVTLCIQGKAIEAASSSNDLAQQVVGNS